MRIAITVLGALALTACSSDSVDDTSGIGGGQFGEESGAHCAIDTETDLGNDETSPLGFTPQEMFDLIEVDETATLVWNGLDDTEYTLTVVTSGVATYTELVIESTGTGAQPAIEPALGCDPYVAVDATVTLSTVDGLLNETWTGEIRRGSFSGASFTGDLDSLVGTLDLWAFVDDPTRYDDLRGWVDIAFDDLGSHGNIRGQASGEDGDIAFATSVDVGSWPIDDSY